MKRWQRFKGRKPKPATGWGVGVKSIKRGAKPKTVSNALISDKKPQTKKVRRKRPSKGQRIWSRRTSAGLIRKGGKIVKVKTALKEASKQTAMQSSAELERARTEAKIRVARQRKETRFESAVRTWRDKIEANRQLTLPEQRDLTRFIRNNKEIIIQKLSERTSYSIELLLTSCGLTFDREAKKIKYYIGTEFV